MRLFSKLKISVAFVLAFISFMPVAPNNSVSAAAAPTVLLTDDFQDGDSAGWTFSGTGTWSVKADPADASNQILSQSKTGNNEAYAVAGDVSWTDYSYEARVKLLDAEPYPGLLARFKDSNNYYMFRINKVSEAKLEVSKKVNGTSTILGSAPFPAGTNTWYSMRIVVKGNSIRCYIDDKRVFDVTDNSLTAGKIGFRTNWGLMGVDDINVKTLPDTAPAAPTGLSAGAITGTSMALTWNTVTEATYYRLYRSTSLTGPFENVYKGTYASYQDAGLTSQTTYYYKVSSETDGLESDASEPITATTVFKIEPPSGLSTTGKTDKTISLQWNPVTGAAYYNLYRASSSTGTYALVYSGTATSFTDTGLASGKTYYYKVSYMGDAEESDRSFAISETTVLVVPDVPTGLTLVKANSQSAEIRWNEVAGADTYILYRAEQPGGPYTSIYQNVYTSYRDSKLKPGTTYYYAVSAVNLKGESGKSPELRVMTPMRENDLIENGGLWYDENDNVIQAHGGSILKVGDTYYWFGEDKAHNKASFLNVAAYSSKDLVHWSFRNNVLTISSAPELADAKIERPKVLYNASTGKYVLWGHKEVAANYNEAKVAVAVSDTVDGNYTYLGSFRPNGDESRDFTLFQDDDGSAYLISSANGNLDLNVYRLTSDYLGIDKKITTLYAGMRREAPAVVKKDGIYYLLTSGQSGWAPNQGQYATATSMAGPWSSLQNFGDNFTFYTQPAFIFPVQGTEKTSYIYVGDRWHPNMLGASEYIWLPLTLDNGTVKMDYTSKLSLDVKTGEIITPQVNLISEQADVSASTYSSGHEAALVNDGSYSTYWEASNKTLPITLTMDMHEAKSIDRIDLTWRGVKGSEAYYQYKIYGSTDNVTYTQLVDRSTNTDLGFTSDNVLDSGKYRYIRITVSNYRNFTNGNFPGYNPGIYEMKVFSPVKPVTAISVASSSGSNIIVTKGGTLQMLAAVAPEDASNKSVTWNVYEQDGITATKKASIDSSGLLTAREDGIVKVVATAADGSGVRGEALVTIDTTPPVTSASATPVAPDGLNGWYTHGLTVALTADDNVSGVARTDYSFDNSVWLPYTAPVTVNQDGKYTISYRSVDKAGNVEAAKSIGFNLDSTAPVILVSGLTDGMSYNDSGDLTPQPTITDNLSGVDMTKTAAMLDGQNVQQGVAIPLYTLPLGSHAFTVTANDAAGNAQSVTVTFWTYADLDSLKALVTRFTDNKGIDNAGISKSLQKRLAQGELGEFVQLVRVQTGKHITNAAAKYLMRDAQAFLDYLKAKVNQFTSDKSINRADLAKDLLEALNEGNVKDFAEKVQEESGKHISQDAAISLLQGLQSLLAESKDNNTESGNKQQASEK